MLLTAVVIGLLVGIVMGALGGGGAILSVPALVYLLDQAPREATTGSLVIVGFSSLVAVLGHARGGRVRWHDGLVFAALGVAGSLLGSIGSAGVDPDVLMTAFAVLLVVVAIVMLRRTRPTDPGGGRRRGPWSSWPRLVRIGVVATGVGLLTGFFGVGGGFAVVPALVLLLGFSMPAAVGTSLLVVAVNSLVALTPRLVGEVHLLDWQVILWFTAAAALGSLFGARIASRADPNRLSRGFAVLLLVVAAYTLTQSLPALG